MHEVNVKNVEINLHTIVAAYTTEPDYEMNRYFLIQESYDRFFIVEGFHCSCFDFDDTQWTAMQYTREELEILSKADYNGRGDAATFWEQVRISLGVTIA